MKPLTLVAALMAVFASAAAHAQVASAVAELKQLHFELIDLDPDDGITPSLSWSSDKPVSYFAMVQPFVFPGHTIQGGSAALGQGLSDAAYNDWPSTRLEVSITEGDIFTLGLGPSLRSAGTSTTGGSLLGGPSLQSVVTLSPHTRLQLSATVGTVALSNVGIGGLAIASLEFCPAPAEGADPCQDRGLINYSSAWVARQAGWVDTFVPGSLTVAWDNTTDSAASKYMSAGTYVQLDATAPVPEPAQWLLFAAGLGVMATKRRRR